MSHAAPIGVLLVNVGTPDAPDVPSVRRYLRAFLGDPRVLTMPAPIRWLLLNLVILPFRPKHSAAAYQAIWTEAGSPLLLESQALVDAASNALGSDFDVRLAMRYGQPSIAAGLEAMEAAGVQQLIVLPLFPQYASAVNDSVGDELERCLAGPKRFESVDVMGAFYDHPGFADAWVDGITTPLAEFGADHVLFSYHGLPESQIRASDRTGGECLASELCCENAASRVEHCYRAQCFATTRLLTSALAIDSANTTTSFQSRVGPNAWIGPPTDQIIEQLHASGVRRLAVFCPSFVADCLETLEEIGIQLRERWMEVGGAAFWLAPCPNGRPAFGQALGDWVKQRAHVPHP